MARRCRCLQVGRPRRVVYRSAASERRDNSIPATPDKLKVGIANTHARLFSLDVFLCRSLGTQRPT